MEVELIDYMHKCNETIKKAVKITSMTEYPDDIIKRIVKAGAESPIEHAVFTFLVTGVSRALTHQLVRHRIASFTQESQRYVTYEKGFKYVTPKSIEEDPELCAKYHHLMENIAAFYHRAVEKNKPKEDARYVFPNACHTSIYITINARSLRNLFKIRCDKRAQWEIRYMAVWMLKICKEILPDAFNDFDLMGGLI